MIKKLSALIILFSITSCSKTQVKEIQQQELVTNQEWALIKKIESEKWNKVQFLNVLGSPSEIIEDKKQALDLLIYEYPQPGHQKWGFEVSKFGKILNITFVPNASNRENFTTEKITQKWGPGCVKRKDFDNTQHFIRYIYFLDCGEKHRAYLNNRGEITSISINIL